MRLLGCDVDETTGAMRPVPEALQCVLLSGGRRLRVAGDLCGAGGGVLDLRKKVADAMEVQRKHELGEAEKQDDLGEFGTICDNTHANPLATAPRSRTRRAPTTN